MSEQKNEGAGEWEGWSVAESLPQSANPATQIINPPELAKPRGFSHGIVVEGGRLLMLAGQDASDAEGRIASPGDLLAQFEQVVKNLKAVVEAVGGTLQDIVKLTIYVTDRDAYRAQLARLGEIHRAYFGRHYPAMALFEVKGLFNADAMIEMEGIAHLKK
ncbi:MAG TPA: RidA family protein [Blastocatellia bacterium]|nr:RidA family protein [Blastocatellia bacterium]